MDCFFREKTVSLLSNGGGAISALSFLPFNLDRCWYLMRKWTWKSVGKELLVKELCFGLEGSCFYLLIFVYSWTEQLNIRAALTLGNLDLVKIPFLTFAHSF